jgi:hypothetical protein
VPARAARASGTMVRPLPTLVVLIDSYCVAPCSTRLIAVRGGARAPVGVRFFFSTKTALTTARLCQTGPVTLQCALHSTPHPLPCCEPLLSLLSACRPPTAVYGAIVGVATHVLLHAPSPVSAAAGLATFLLTRSMLPDVSRGRLLEAERNTLQHLARWPVWEAWSEFRTAGAPWRVRSLVCASHQGLAGPGARLLR